MATTTKRQMRHETSTESAGVGEEGGKTFPQATSTPLALGVNVLGDADLSPVIYKRQCDEGEWQVQPGRLLTIATQLSGDVGSAFIHRQRANRCGSHKGKI